MVILKNPRKKGFGEATILYCEKHCTLENTTLIWLNRCDERTDFYEN
jgi:hypothetical protein